MRTFLSAAAVACLVTAAVSAQDQTIIVEHSQVTAPKIDCSVAAPAAGFTPNLGAGRDALRGGMPLLAVAHLKPLADTVPEAARLYGGLLLTGNACVPADKVRAEALLRQAAAAKDIPAMVFLGGVYRQGKTLPQNDAEALRYYRMAAEAGDMPAAVNLGLMYRDGRGTAPDGHLYLYWTAKAAAAGRPVGLMNIALAYHNGTFLPKDDEAAYFWISVAMGRILAADTTNRQHMIRIRSELAALFSDEDRQRIARKASRWQPGEGALDDVLKAEVHTP